MNAANGPAAAPARRVLVVEDEGALAFLLEDMLLELGHTVVATVGRIEDALAVRDGEYDFAVLDVNLNGHRSYALAERLRAFQVPFIFTTGYGTSGLADPWKDWIVLGKPFVLRDLENAMKAAIARQSAGKVPTLNP